MPALLQTTTALPASSMPTRGSLPDPDPDSTTEPAQNPPAARYAARIVAAPVPQSATTTAAPAGLTASFGSWQSKLVGMRAKDVSQSPPAGRKAERMLRAAEPLTHTTVKLPASSMPASGALAVTSAAETFTGAVQAAPAWGAPDSAHAADPAINASRTDMCMPPA